MSSSKSKRSEETSLREVVIKGVEGTTLTVNVHTVLDEHGSYKIYLYAKAMIVNETLTHALKRRKRH